MFKRCFWCMLLIIPCLCRAQTGQSRRAARSIDKGDLLKARELLSKALEKDSADARAWYQLARLFYTHGSSRQLTKSVVDSAHYFLQTAGNIYDTLSPDQREAYKEWRFGRVPLDSLTRLVDSAAFVLSREVMTEPAMEDYVQNYSLASDCHQAVILRDSLAFLSAQSVNTWEAYLSFYQKYPDAREAELAVENYERLYYRVSTRDGTLLSYSNFLINHPASPYRTVAEQQIMQIMTADGDPETFINFIHLYPESPSAATARNFLFHLARTDRGLAELDTDSLNLVRERNTGAWYPYNLEGQLYYMDASGRQAAGPFPFAGKAGCAALDEDFLFTGHSLLSRNGTVVLEGNLLQPVDAGAGVILYKTDQGYGAIHKSGFTILPPLQDSIRLIDDRFLAFLRGRRWGLASLTGRVLLPAGYDEVYSDNEMIFAERAGNILPLTHSMLRKLADHESVNLEYYCRAYQFVNNALWMDLGNREVLTDLNLHPLIGPDAFQIHAYPGVYLMHKDPVTEWVTADLLQKYSTDRPLLSNNERYALLGGEDGMAVFDMYQFRVVDHMDSAFVAGRGFVMAFRKDECVVLHRGFEPALPGFLPESWKVIAAGNAEYLYLQNKRKSILYNGDGEVIRTGNFNGVTAILDSVLVVTERDKRGLIRGDGTVLLPPEYEAIGNYDGELLALLKSGKISAYDLKEKKRILAASGKRLIRLHTDRYLGERQGKVGITDAEGRELVPYAFDQVYYWNDSISLVKQGNIWHLFENGRGLSAFPDIKSLVFVREDKNEREAIVLLGDRYGVMNSRSGIVLQAEYDDIRAVGSGKEWVYLTATRVEEGGYYLLAWFDRSGRMLRKQTAGEGLMEQLFCY